VIPTPSTTADEMYDIPDVAARLGVSTKTVRRFIARGEPSPIGSDGKSGSANQTSRSMSQDSAAFLNSGMSIHNETSFVTVSLKVALLLYTFLVTICTVLSTSVTRIPPMTTASASRTVPTTLAEVITMIIEDGDLKPKSRQELASAVRVICRLFGFPPAEVPADPALLRRRLEPLTPTATGMRPGSLRNLKSCSTRR